MAAIISAGRGAGSRSDREKEREKAKLRLFAHRSVGEYQEEVRWRDMAFVMLLQLASHLATTSRKRLGTLYEPQGKAGHFSLSPVRVDERLLIHSLCLKCGTSKIVSAQDGTLYQWVNEHTCKPVAPPADTSAY